MKHWPIEKQVEVLNSSLRGHYNYYGIAGNGRKLSRFWSQVIWDWKNSLSGRSQKGRLTWEKFEEILRRFPLISPKIRVDYSKLQSFSRL